MKININKKNYLNFIKTASILTTGGGFPLEDQIKYLKKFSKINTSILSLDEFPKDSYICTAAELGPTDAPPLKKEKVIRKMFDLVSKVTNKKISGFYPPEIGQENVMIEASQLLNLPIADFDPVGLRAVPYIDINIFNLRGLNFNYTPMAVSDDQNEIFLIDNVVSYSRLETILRNMTSFSKSGVIFLLGGVLPIDKLIKNKINQPSYSKIYELGKIKDINKLIKALNPKIVIDAEIVRKEEFQKKGFLGEIVYIIDKNNTWYKLVILNEIIFILNQNNKILYSVPDRILLIDPENLCGISSAFLRPKLKVLISVIEPENDWKMKNVEKIFGKNRFKELIPAK